MVSETTVIIPISYGQEQESLARLCIAAYSKGWRIPKDHKPIVTLSGAKRVVELYGSGFIERSLSVTICDMRLDATRFDMLYGPNAAFKALEIGSKPLTI